VLSLSSFRFRFSRSVPTRRHQQRNCKNPEAWSIPLNALQRGNSPHLPLQSYFMPGVMIR
jgi:hypothetical protein